jgi:hypothetical protein
VGFRLGSAGLVVLWTTAGCELAFPLDRYNSLPEDGGPAESGSKDGTSTDSTSTDAPPAAITYVQGNVVSVKTQDAVVPLGSVRSHDAIIVCIDVDDETTGVSSVTDALDNTYIQVFGPIYAGGRQYVVYLAQDIDGGASTSVTATLGEYTNSVLEVFALEYSGLASSNPFDTSSNGMGTSSGETSGPATTRFSHELVLGFGGPGEIMMDSTFRLALRSTGGNIVESKFVTTAGKYEATATTTSGTSWEMIMATFRGQ